MGAEFPFYAMERAVEMDGGDGAQDRSKKGGANLVVMTL